MTEEEIVSLNDCNSELAGDLVMWSPSRWSLKDGATSFSQSFRTLCDTSFSDELIIVPDTVTFPEAKFLCSVLSGEVYTSDHPTYPGDSLYDKIKAEVT